MSSSAAIRTDDLGKRYELGAGPAHEHLRDRIVSSVKEAGRSLRGLLGAGEPRPARPDIWALRHVSIEVRAGDVVGIIGGNGAGKSTLLKILSRITPPTEGRAEIRGRVGSLLEVGTGFHPDLTGRENVFLNGAILGMGRDEIRRKFDAIVEFAEVARFIDTAVKHYSSGMYVRLAFAVAAHLEPEILVVDEVLAVGDAKFQRKCIGKMDEVARGGRTVLFVSHNMAAIQRLCSRAVLLDAGRVVADGDPRRVVAHYLAGESRARYVAAARTGHPQVREAELVDQEGRPLPRPLITEPMAVRMHVSLPEAAPGLRCGIGVLTADGVTVFTSNLGDGDKALPSGPGNVTVTATIPEHTLLAGDYQVATCLWTPLDIIDLQEPAFAFSADTGPSPLYREGAQRKGLVNVPCRWDVR